MTFATVTTFVTFLLGEATTNWSSVDRLWAILPVLYSAHFTFHDRWSGAGSVKGLFDWSSKSATGTDPAASWFSALVPNGVNDRMFLVFLLQVGRSCSSQAVVNPANMWFNTLSNSRLSGQSALLATLCVEASSTSSQKVSCNSLISKIRIFACTHAINA